MNLQVYDIALVTEPPYIHPEKPLGSFICEKALILVYDLGTIGEKGVKVLHRPISLYCTLFS